MIRLIITMLALLNVTYGQSAFEKNFKDSVSIPGHFSMTNKVLIVSIPFHWKKWENKVAEIMKDFKGSYELFKAKSDAIENIRDIDKKYPDTQKYHWELTLGVQMDRQDLFHKATIGLTDRSFKTPFGSGRPYPFIAEGRADFDSFLIFAVQKLNNRIR